VFTVEAEQAPAVSGPEEHFQAPPSPRRASARKEEPYDEDDDLRRPRRRPVPEYDEEEDYEQPRRRERRAGWNLVRIGVTLILAALVIMLLLIPVGIIGLIVVFVTASPKGGGDTAGLASLLVLGVVLGVMFVLATLLSLVGDGLCVAAPPKHGARALAITSLALAVLALGLTGASFLLGPLRLLANLASLTQSFVFLFFLRAVARCIRARQMESNVGKLIILNAVVVGGAVLMVAGAFALGVAAELGGEPGPRAARGTAGIALGCTGCIELVLAFAALVWYIFVLFEARSEIGSYLDRR
jgi:hypothetical protein